MAPGHIRGEVCRRYTAAIQLLFICSGNIFRSPMAAAFAGAISQRRGLELTVTSAGTLPGERAIPDMTLEAIGSKGLDMTGHVSRPLTAELVRASDLILGLAGEHVREAVVLDDASWPRAFTLKEIVRRGTRAGPRRPDQSLQAWIALVHAGRRRDSLVNPDRADDVADPVDGPWSVVRATGRAILQLTDQLLNLLYP